MAESTFSIAIVGIKDFQGRKAFHPGMPLVLIKEPENSVDAEMIIALTDAGPVGIVANSVETVPLGCASAGRIYDMFPDAGLAVVRYVMENVVIADLVTGENGEDAPDFVYVGVRMLTPSFPDVGNRRS